MQDPETNQAEGVICRLNLPCCSLGLKVPDKCVKGENACLCLRGYAALPFTYPVPEPVCAICFAKILPAPFQFLGPPPDFKAQAPEGASMDR